VRRGETLAELNALAGHVQAYAHEYGLPPLTFAAVCADADETFLRRLCARHPFLRFYRADARALRLLRIHRVPARLLLDADARLRRCWDGLRGAVLLGNHGPSLTNGSHSLLDNLLSIVHSHSTCRDVT